MTENMDNEGNGVLKNGMSLEDHVDHQRWLIDHGFINDLHKDNLYMYGAILHTNVQAVHTSIDTENKKVEYYLYADDHLLKLVDKYNKLTKLDGIVGLWRLKRFLKKEGNLNFEHMLNRFVKDYCGPKWSATLFLKNIKDYEDGTEEKNREGDAPPDQRDNR